MTNQEGGYSIAKGCHTWERKDRRSGKVVVVFDDYYGTRTAPTPYAWGLETLAAVLPSRDEVVGVGLLDLPTGETERLASIAQTAEQCTSQWRGASVEFYVLVDMYRGNNDEPSGPSLIEMLTSTDCEEDWARRSKECTHCGGFCTWLSDLMQRPGSERRLQAPMVINMHHLS